VKGLFPRPAALAQPRNNQLDWTPSAPGVCRLIRPVASTVLGHLEGSLILLSAGRDLSARIAALSQNVKCVTEDLVARGRACDGACT
jgi:hypothetical protein